MTTTAPSTALVMIQPAFTDAERLALVGFLAGYRGPTREAYAGRNRLIQANSQVTAPAASYGAVRAFPHRGVSFYELLTD